MHDKVIDSPPRQEMEGFVQNLRTLSEKNNVTFSIHGRKRSSRFIYFKAIIIGIKNKEPSEIM